MGRDTFSEVNWFFFNVFQVEYLSLGSPQEIFPIGSKQILQLLLKLSLFSDNDSL